MARKPLVDSAAGPRRDQIRDAAVELFRSRGYDRTPLREIASRLGLSKSGLYHHFPSKDELLSSLVEPLLDDLTRLLDATTRSPRSDPERRSFLAAYLDILLAQRHVVGLISTDAAVRAHPRIGLRLAEIDEALCGRLAGENADLAQQVRAAHALIGLQDAVARFADADPQTVRRASLAAAAAAVSS